MNGGNSTLTKMLENSIKLNIHTYLVQECRVECRRMEELAFLHEVLCLHLPLALQVNELKLSCIVCAIYCQLGGDGVTL